MYEGRAYGRTNVCMYECIAAMFYVFLKRNKNMKEKSALSIPEPARETVLRLGNMKNSALNP
jgi:hypothetical protein